MRRVFWLLLLLFFVSCGRKSAVSSDRIITVSIAPFKYFVDEISGNDFKVNVMVPAGADPHTYEPFPEQITKLRHSVAYISNGYLGFEMNWLDRFYETNPTMKKLSLGEKIDPVVSKEHHPGEHVEGADPHYWVSPKCAQIMAASIKDFLCALDSTKKEKYTTNYDSLVNKIVEVDNKARELFSDIPNKSFMIYHPNLAYLARDYGLEEIPVEFEGKEPPPSRMKNLIDHAREHGLNTIFVQREYDKKNAKAIAGEIGAEIVIIDPLSEDWYGSTMNIIKEIHISLTRNSK